MKHHYFVSWSKRPAVAAALLKAAADPLEVGTSSHGFLVEPALWHAAVDSMGGDAELACAGLCDGFVPPPPAESATEASRSMSPDPSSGRGQIRKTGAAAQQRDAQPATAVARRGRSTRRGKGVS